MKCKNLLALLLCLSLLTAALALPVNAAPSMEPCDCGEVVQVFMLGYGSALYLNQGTPEQQKVEMADTANLTPAILKLLGYMALSIVTFNADYMAKGVSGLLMGLMGHLQMDEQGNSIGPISADWRIDEARDHTESPEYRFEYDYRIDPFEAADQLNDFIERLCEVTGHEKIALTGFSEGANVVMAYLSVYGYGRLETFLLVNGAWQGLTLVGSMLTRQVGLSGPAITNYLADLDDGSGWLRLAMTLLRVTHLLDFTKPLGQVIVKTMGETLYREALIPLFCQMPAIWAFVPAEYYAEARKLLEGDPKYETLLARTDRYHDEVQTQAYDLLLEAQEAGVRIAVICGYNGAPVPATVQWDYHTDNLIDTARASGGATVAPFGKTLCPSDSPYRSPDGIIDAATCMFPDQTWFIKNLRHEDAPSKALRMWIIYSGEVPTIYGDEAFPQYLQK